ncbi:HD-GYP domain-containing protein [Paenibacillus flagellatus]|nr:HD domain-containing phosphohydrolase [Paenibacillus flagellatus]
MRTTVATVEQIEQDVKALERREPQVAFLLKRLKRHHAPTYRQSLLTAHYSLQLAQALGFDGNECRVLYRTALLHDIGKLHVSRELLDSRHRLYQGDVWKLQEHPKHGADILAAMIADGSVDGEAVLHHHENLDGTGYPFGLTWKAISLNARIIRLASNYTDMTDAQTSLGLSHEEALEELYAWSDVLFDADLVELMNHLFRERMRDEKRKGEIAYDVVKRNRKS